MAQLKLTRQGKSNASGELTLEWPSVASGQYWHCSVVVPTAPQSATGQVLVNGLPRFSVLGSQCSTLIEVGGGSIVSLFLSGLAKTTVYTATVLGGVQTGQPPGAVPTGPSTLTLASVTVTNPITVEQVVTPVTVKVTELPPPPVATVGILSVKVKLLGPTVAVPIVPAAATQTYFAHCKIGFVIWGTSANKGANIYLGDAAGGVSAAASIPAGVTKLVGSFSVAFGNAVTMRISGTTGDYANVWAA